MSRCARCGAEFSCGVTDGPANAPCWCMQVPALPAAALEDYKAGDRDGQTRGCLCRACLLTLLPAAAR
ncbi:cysteine-rich CWC family protein [Janthinobacterium sp. 17J80-10]|uniref:cysteine-rich CWC family protein n=1 Tax=Janthinobacterium sp. 17J80-10 TaxID=2497863 RepID=UPI0010052CCC|nr:cysteine-rich CWC family protein [Janthinobacterium sp. 17J80-10]QAU33245.1 hypothetical protein EKL02_03070 [Janthinobacterium sp. 17J80-10]